MTPHYADDWLTVYHGDARTVMASMEPESVHCVVTSPPYWGLRDYGTATWVGGDEACDHPTPPRQPRNERPLGSFHGGSDEGNASREPDTRRVCHLCGAVREDGQLGLEPTPEAYVENMVAVFREVRRVLRSDGTVWLNLGDSYATGGGAVGRAPGGGDQGARFIRAGMINTQPNRMPIPGLKPKDLVGIPWRVAFALQADGWYLRSDIIWSKPNPMPESVTDRPTKSHEYLFLLSKSPRYYFDADAVREPSDMSPDSGWAKQILAGRMPVISGGIGTDKSMAGTGASTRGINPAGRNLRSVWTVATQPYGSTGAGPGDTPDTTSPDCPVHSLRAIRRMLQTDGDDGLRDHLRSRNRGTGARPAPVRDDGLFASSLLDSPALHLATQDSPTLGSSPAPTDGSGHASRTTDRPTSGGGPGSDAGTPPRTSHTLGPTTSQDQAASSDVHAATGRSALDGRTSAPSGVPDSLAPEPEYHRPGTGVRPSADDVRCSCPDNSASHFATFPPKLIEPCIKAGTSERGVCPACGAPWEREVHAPRMPDIGSSVGKGYEGRHAGGTVGVRGGGNGEWKKWRDANPPQTTGWRPPCTHEVDSVPATVLDPFAGSGTTGMVAQSLSRRAVLIDLSMDYLGQLMDRNRNIPLGLGA